MTTINLLGSESLTYYPKSHCIVYRNAHFYSQAYPLKEYQRIGTKRQTTSDINKITVLFSHSPTTTTSHTFPVKEPQQAAEVRELFLTAFLNSRDTITNEVLL